MLRGAKNRALRRAYAAAAKPALGGPRADAKATNGALAAIFGSGGKATTFAPMSETHAHDAPTEARATAPPTTSVTVLANGATIASENTPGATLACGAYVDCGSARGRAQRQACCAVGSPNARKGLAAPRGRHGEASAARDGCGGFIKNPKFWT